MVGAKPSVSSDVLFQVLINYEIFQPSGELKSKNDAVWISICEKWDNLMKPINLFHYVRQDRHNVLSDYKRSKGLVHDIVLDERASDSFVSDSDSNNCDPNDTYEPYCRTAVQKKFKRDRLNFDIVYSEVEWAALKPKEKFCKNGRSYFALQKGWPDVLVKSIWQLQKLPCVYVFKRASVCIDGTLPFLRIHGQCKDCSSVLYGECPRKPKDNENIIIRIKTVDTRGIPHLGKRPLAGPERKGVKEILRYKKARAFRREVANREMDHDGVEPAHLYSSPVLRKVRQEAKDEELGIKNPLPLWESLNLLIDNVEFRRTFRNMGYRKFFIFYWSPEQISMHNDIQKLGLPVSIDASGGVARKISHGDQTTSGPIFVYVIVSHVGRKIVPLCQMLSERHDVGFITLWLNDFLKSGAAIPREVVTDMSKALQNAVSSCFNAMKYQQYLEHCFNILRGDRNLGHSLNTLILIDIAHLIHNITSFKCFSQVKNSRIKEFYCKCIGYLSTVQTLEEFNDTLKALFIVCQNEVDNTLKCREARNWLIERIQTFHFDEFNIKPPREDVEDLEDKNMFEILESDRKSNKENILSHHIENIRQEAFFGSSDNTAGSLDFNIELNPFYFPQITENLVKLAKEFPAWTNVMRQHFNSNQDVATSARSESYFSDLKDSLLDNGKPLRVDKLFIKHSRLIDATMKLCRAEYIKLQNEKATQKNICVKADVEHLRLKENWRGLILPNESYVPEDSENLNDAPDSPLHCESNLNSVLRSVESAGPNDEIISINPDKTEGEAGDNIGEQSPLIGHLQDIEPITHDTECSNKDTILCEPMKNYMATSSEKPIVISDNDSLISTGLIPNAPLNTNISSYASFTKDIDFDSTKRERSIGENYSFKKIDDNVFSIVFENEENITLLNQNISPGKDRCSVEIPVTSNAPVVNPPLAGKRQRGKYVTPDPELLVKLQKPKGNQSRGIIQNGNLLLPRRVNKERVYFINTCAFDSIAEIVASSYCNVQTFRNFVDIECESHKEDSFSFLKAVQVYAIHGTTSEFYKRRANILQARIQNHVDGVIDCDTNVGQFFGKVMQQYPCMKEIMTCSNHACKWSAEKSIPTIEVQAPPIWQRGIVCLQEQINLTLLPSMKMCLKCQQLTGRREILMGPYLSIDMDFIYQKSHFAESFKITDMTSRLKDIPTHIQIGDKKYLLCGVVQYVKPKLTDGLGHYIAYCRSVTGGWQVRNDLHKRAEVVNVEKVPDMKIALIFYTDITLNF